MRIQNNGDVSITGGLNVKGGLIDLTELPGADGWRNILGHSATQGISLVANTGAHDGAAIELNSSVSASTGRPGTIHYYSQGDELNQYGHVFINNRTDISNRALMGIKKDGKVVIGENLVWGAPPSGMASTTPGNYLLYVEKGILTEKLKVANRTDFMNWSDFVFNKDYQLMPLAELESYINTNKHLPEIPTADEVAKDGIDVAEMDAKLLQKIEELTLYVIQLEKDMHELKKNKLSK